jgi:predicted CXXCH cytochrome family protein
MVVVLVTAIGSFADNRLESLTEDQCVLCHTELESLPEGLLEADVHLREGLSCGGCHGGDPTAEDQDEAMSPEAGFVGVPSKNEIPGFCGKCHSDITFMRGFQPGISTDQVRQYETSRHGERLLDGDKKVADCVSCHTSHAILPHNDARSTVYPLNVPATCERCHGDPQYMEEYGIPTDQSEKFAGSVHGVALLENRDTGAPACNDCHGNHGARPPGVTSVIQICGQCHVNNMEYFAVSVMADVWETEGYGGCGECHGNHGVQKPFDDMVGTGENSLCVGCHDEGDAGYEAARAIRGHLARLSAANDEAEAKREEVHRRGMGDEDIVFLLQESHQDLVQARTLVHTFDPDQVGEKTGEGVIKAREALDLAFERIRESGNRRRWFGLATVFIIVLILATYLKVRQIEGP